MNPPHLTYISIKWQRRMSPKWNCGVRDRPRAKNWLFESIKAIAVVLLTVCSLSTTAQQMEVGINLPSVPPLFNSGNPYVNMLRISGQWNTNYYPFRPGDTFDLGVNSDFDFDQNGYPLEVPIILPGDSRGVVVGMLIRNANVYRPKGRYVVLYEGQGEIVIAGTTKQNETPGRFEIDITSDNRSVYMYIVSSKKGNHVRNIQFLIPGTESTYKQNPYYQGFLDRASVATVIRFMSFLKTKNSPWRRWDDREQPNRIGSDIPTYEETIDLCNRVCADLWATVPHQADSTFIATLAKLVKERLRPQLKVYIEYSNEVWNSSFEQGEWIDKNTPITPTSNNPQLARAQRVAWQFKRVYRIWTNVFGDQSNRIVRVAAAVGANDFYTAELLRSIGANGCDAVALNYYLNPMRFDHQMRVQLPSLSEDTIFHYARRSLREFLAPAWRKVSNIVKQYGFRIISYEAGQHFWELGLPGDDPLAQRLTEVQASPQMYNVYHELFDTLRNQQVTMFNAFTLVSPHFSGLAFGHLQYIDQPIQQAPKYKAIADLRDEWNKNGGRVPACGGSLPDAMPPSSMWLTAETGANAGEINLKWADESINWKRPYDNEGVVAYDFYADGALLLSFTEVNASNTVLKGLQPGKEYKIVARVRDGAGNESDSNEAIAVAAPDNQPPAAFTLAVNAAPQPASAVLTWTAATDNFGLAGYYIYIDDKLVDSTDVNTLFYTAAELVDGTTYTFYVVARDVAGNTTLSNEVTFEASAEASPASFEFLRPRKVFSKSRDISWTIEGISACPDCVVTIFTRSGVKVYEGTNYETAPWNGTFNGELLTEGVYSFAIRSAGTLARSGTIMIIK